ncbi:ankyrin repeat domain-containing protein [Serratia aquatilis]|uniref:Ankyrin repeat domain-containing protein n=1 Tax=Serratia aquatilis TaxID=1737515 RepID=A0ABV6E8H4_9GAMM
MKRLFIAGLITFSAFNLYAQENNKGVDLSKFRFSYTEMQKIANSSLLPHRIFYQKASEGPNAAWFDAVKQGNLAQVKKMVESGQNLEVKDEASLGQTALGWAAFIGYLDIVQYLTEKGADIRATDRADVYNSVKSAVMGNNVEVVKYLHERLKNEIDWDAIEKDGETLFMVAAVDGRLDTVKYILQFNPNLDVITDPANPEKGTSPLSGACEHGFTEVANLLIQKGAINHKTGRSSCN